VSEKVIQKIDFGHFKNVHFEKSEYSFEKHEKIKAYGLDALSFKKNNYNFVIEKKIKK
jgi:hypothetical protein